MTFFFSKNDRKFGEFHVFVVFENFRVRNEGVTGIKPEVTSDQLLDSPSSLSCICSCNNLASDQESLRALFKIMFGIRP